MARPHRTAEYQSRLEWDVPTANLAVRKPAANLRRKAPTRSAAIPTRSAKPVSTAYAAQTPVVTATLIKITVHSAIIVAAVGSLVRLVPLYVTQQERLAVLSIEVERMDQRVAQVQVAVDNGLNLEQASAAMRDRVNYIPPNQLHILLDTPDVTSVATEPVETPQTGQLFGFFWPWR